MTRRKPIKFKLLGTIRRFCFCCDKTTNQRVSELQEPEHTNKFRMYECKRCGEQKVISIRASSRMTLYRLMK